MFHIDFNQPIHVHFVGIGGISMSGLAEILLKRGFKVSGSDLNRATTSDKLRDLGVQVHIGHKAENIGKDIDLIVYTVAVKLDNPELVQAKALDIPIIDRATLLGQVMEGYANSIAVAGTHGKTTTTSMVAHILTSATLDPTVSVGGILPLINGNIHAGSSNYFVTEACEYYNSYHHFYPKVGLVLNVEEDHLDFFKDIDEIRRSFHRFHENIPSNGALVIQGDTLELDLLTKDLKAQVITYSDSNQDCDYYARDISYNALGHPSFTVMAFGQILCQISLSVPGAHNINNALGSIATARVFDIDCQPIIDGLKAFTGTHRRFEFKGDLGGIHIVDDYAHHPTEIKATIDGVKNMTIGKLHIVFQPHTFTRTKAFLDEFAESLAQADEVILMDIYSASREKDLGDIHSKDIMEKINALGTPCYYYPTIDEIIYHVFTHCVPGDLLITMGAGDVYLLGDALLKG